MDFLTYMESLQSCQDLISKNINQSKPKTVKQEIIFHSLIDFNGLTFSKKQWETILKGCGAPKNFRFWSALRSNVMVKIRNNVYRLHITSMCEIEQAWNEYCINNRASVKEAYYRKKAEVKQVYIYNNCTFK